MKTGGLIGQDNGMAKFYRLVDVRGDSNLIFSANMPSGAVLISSTGAHHQSGIKERMVHAQNSMLRSTPPPPAPSNNCLRSCGYVASRL
jgi:hypothetical protein